MKTYYDVIIIGGGPAGYIAALKSISLNLRTALIDKNKLLGGTCLHKGCIPTKTLLYIVDLFHKSKKSSQLGIECKKINLNWDKAQQYKNKIINMNALGIKQLLNSKNIDIFNGIASFNNNSEIIISNNNSKSINIKAKNILICVGSKPQEIKLASFNNPKILNSTSILELKKIPKALTIIGAGTIGIEFASIFSRIGTKITILEQLDRILPQADLECSIELERILTTKNIKIYKQIRINKINDLKNKIQINFYKNNDSFTKIESEYILIATGRNPLTANLNLDKAGIKTKNGFIIINDYFQTTNNNIYAAGDCINTISLAHVASKEAICAIEHIANKKTQLINYDCIPNCVYSSPGLSWCGLTESKAIQNNYDILIGKSNFTKNAKASILNKRDGFIKIISEKKYGEILGIHIISEDAHELIAEPSFAMQLEATIEDIKNTIHAHPTLYESISEAAEIVINQIQHA